METQVDETPLPQKASVIDLQDRLIESKCFNLILDS